MNSVRTILLCLAAWLAMVAPLPAATAPWQALAKKPDAWFAQPDGQRAVENVLSWQAPSGAWPKNTDTAAQAYAGDANKLQGTFDNGATTGELRFLARALRATKEPRVEAAFLKGFEHILAAQYTNGGWPQYAPPPANKYHRHITFNDGAMERLMEFLREASENFPFLDQSRRQRARAAFDRGVECILRCQVVVDGRLTVWCAQHDEVTLEPRPARTFELASLSGAESAGLLRLLMSLENPSPKVRRAIEAGAAWFDSAQLKGIRIAKVDGDKRVVKDVAAPPLWARFYEIGSNRPLFAGRDGVKKYDVAEIEAERRNGYAWHGPWGQRVAEDFAKWRQRPGNR
jgi:pectate lyase